MDLLPNKDSTNEDADNEDDGAEGDDSWSLEWGSAVVVCVYLLEKKETYFEAWLKLTVVIK